MGWRSRVELRESSDFCSGGVPSAGTLVSPAAPRRSRPAARDRKKLRSAKTRRPGNESRHAALIWTDELQRGTAGRAVSDPRTVPHAVVIELASPVVSDMQPPKWPPVCRRNQHGLFNPGLEIEFGSQVYLGRKVYSRREPTAFAIAGLMVECGFPSHAAHQPIRGKPVGTNCASPVNAQGCLSLLPWQGVNLLLQTTRCMWTRKSPSVSGLFAPLPRAPQWPNPTVLGLYLSEFHGRKP